MRASAVARLVSLLAIGGLALTAQAKTARRADPYARLDVFSKVLSYVEKEYVEKISRTDLIQGAIEGLLGELDPYSAYLTAEEVRALKAKAAGEVGRTGLEEGLARPDPAEPAVIIAPVEGSPAWREGLKAGDRLLAVDGDSTEKTSIHRLVQKLEGDRGTVVRLRVDRPEWAEPKDIDVERAVVTLPAVQAVTLARSYGYLRIAFFRDRADKELSRELKRLEAENGGALKGLILDLRGNPGGLVDTAVSVSDQFIGQGVVVSTEGRRRKLEKHYAQPGGTRDGFPLVALIDGGTASAAEIVAGALQDHGRALVLGTKSFGKGSVQEIIELPDGAALKLTTQVYYTPKHRSIEGKGIEPDIEVRTSVLPALDGGAEFKPVREKDLEGHFSAEGKDGVEPAKTADGKPTDAAFEPSPEATKLMDDVQVKAALDYLKSWELFRGLKGRDR